MTNCTKDVDRDSISHVKKRGVAEEFRHLSWEDLATISFQVVLQKPAEVPVTMSEARRPLELVTS